MYSHRPCTAGPRFHTASTTRCLLNPQATTTIRPSTAGSLANYEFTEEAVNLRRTFPNLPGFRKNIPLRPESPKRQSLNFVNGMMMADCPFQHNNKNSIRPSTAPVYSNSNRPLSSSSVSVLKEVQDPFDVSGRYSHARKKKEQENDSSDNVFLLPFGPDSKLPSFLEHDRRVLLFNAFFEEDVHQSALEVKRIHFCEIYFYVEDSTIEIIQTKQQNSGIPQGVFLRRSRVAKSDSSSSEKEYYEINDMKIGNVVEIYRRKFHIVDCNESTRRYVLRHHNWSLSEVSPLPLPHDRFLTSNEEKMKRESGVPGVDRKRKMHDLKLQMESMLGKQMSTTDRGMFLQCGQDTLCFHAVWDDRQRLYGDIQYFKLFYFLADDTIEILPVHKKNDGRDTFPKLLKRSKLPKPNTSISNPQYYTSADLRIGHTLNVFGRDMLLATCDPFTRRFFQRCKGVELNPDLPLDRPPEDDKPIVFERHIPPYNGFGSEEDSLRSCTTGINPPPPRKDFTKISKLGVVLRYNAHLVSDKKEDHNRRFVIQYFMEDDTIGIREPPIRNSGIVGGSFLRRQQIKKPDGSRYLAHDMYIGNTVCFVGHRFVLLNADEFTYKLMENDAGFPFSDFSRLYTVLLSKKEEVKKYFVSVYRGDGSIDLQDLSHCCESIGLKLNKQEILTIWRKLDKKNKGRVKFTKLVKLVSDVPFASTV